MNARAAVAVFACASALGLTANADDTQRAREAYDHGTAAHRRGDFAEAAADYAQADALAPSPVALRAALDEAVKADDPALGMELLDRTNRAPMDQALATSAAAARAKFKGRAGRIVVHCPPSHACLSTLDDRKFDVEKPVWATVGQHTVIIQIDEAAQPHLIEVKPDETLEVTPPLAAEAAAATPVAPPPPVASPTPAAVSNETAPPEARRKGLSPVWFFVGVGATAVAGGATVISALDTSSKHQSFVNEGCGRLNTSGCGTLASDGTSAQTRTNVLLGVTAAIG